MKSVNAKACMNIRDQNDVDFVHSTGMVGFSLWWRALINVRVLAFTPMMVDQVVE